MDDEQTLIAFGEFAPKLGGISRQTVMAMVEKGIFPPPLRLSPRRVLWKRAEIFVWLAEKLGTQ